MDLTNYAGRFILVIIIGIALLMLAAYRMGKQAASILLVALIGGFVGLWFNNLCNFDDASLETVVTIMASTLLPASIIVCRWAFLFLLELYEQKIQMIKTIIIDDFEVKKRKLYKEKELFVKDMLINKSMDNLLVLLQSCISMKLDFYENHEISKYKEKRSEIMKSIDDREKELNMIDRQIEAVRTENRYFRLLRIRRGDMK